MGTPKQATLWTILEFVISRALNIVFIAVLARLLTPEDFGTVALLAIFLGISSALIESGFGLALIQKQDITDEDISTAFWISFGAATGIALVLVFMAPAIALFFDLGVLVQLTYIMALTIWVSGFGIVSRALLVKKLAFRKLALINVFALLISGSSSIYLAMSGLGVFTLAWQAFISALSISILFWILNDWRPKFFYSNYSAGRLFKFGGYMLASRLLDVIYTRGYTILIGKSYGVVELGQFNRAESIAHLATGLVAHPISQVAFPSFAKMNGDRALIRSGLKGAVRASMLINAVAMFSLAATARPFVLTLLGSQWESAVPILQVLCLSFVLMPMHILNLQALMALGRSDLFLLLELAKKIIGVAIIVYALRFGVMGIAWSFVIAGFIGFIINAWYSGILLNYGPLRQLNHVGPAFVVGSLAGGAAHLATEVITIQTPAFQLLIGLSSAAVAFVFLVGLSWTVRRDVIGLELILQNYKKRAGSQY